jgi:hypothetical protein
MFKKIAFLLSFALVVFSVPQTVSFGIYIDNIYDINWHNNTATLSFTIWNVYDHSVENPEAGFSIENAVSEEIISKSIDQIAPNVWVATVKYKAQLYQSFNVQNFPFAKEDIIIEVASNEPIDEVVYDIDHKNSVIAKEARVANWRVKEFTLDESKAKYGFSIAKLHTNATNTYAKVIGVITLHRGGWKLFGEMFMVTYIGFILASTVFFLRTTEFGGKSNLFLAALFAMVGNKLSLDNYLPLTDHFTFSDWIQIISFLYVAVLLIASLINMPKFKDEEEIRKSLKRDKLLGIIFPAAYIIVNIALIIYHL